MQFLSGLTVFIHLAAAIFWVGGIFLVYMVFRPVAIEKLEPPQRLQMFLGVFDLFFPWVWLFIVLLVVSGYTDWKVRFGGFDAAPMYLLAMELVGWVMVFLFAWLYFVLYKRFKQQVEAANFAEAGMILNNKMRPIIVTNLALGVLEALIGVSGSYF